MLEDHAFLRTLVNTPGWIRFIGERNVHDEAAAVAYTQRILSADNIRYWVVREGGAPIGVVTLIKRDYLPHWDIGFAFLPEAGGRGLALEAARVVLREALRDPAHRRILATTVPDNERSMRLLEKLGLRQEGEIEVEGERLLLFGMDNKGE